MRLEGPNVKREVLRQEPLVLAMPCEHPLAADSSPISLTAIKPYPLLIYPRQPRPSYADQVLSICHDLGIELGTVHEVNEMQTALGLVAAGMGLCIVPAGVQKLRREDVVYRPLTEANAVSPIIMSTRLHDRSPDLLLLRSLIDEVYQQGSYPGKVAAPASPSQSQ